MSKEDHRRLFETFCKERYYGKGTSKTVTEEKQFYKRSKENKNENDTVNLPCRTTPFTELPKGKEPCVMEEEVADLMDAHTPSVSPVRQASHSPSITSHVKPSRFTRSSVSPVRPASHSPSTTSRAIAFATDVAYGNNPASHEYEQTKLRSHFLECLSKKQIVPFPSKPIKPCRKAQIRAHVVCQLKLIYTWPSVPYARSGITSPVNIFLMQYLEIQIVTGNALCVSKDELNRYNVLYSLLPLSPSPSSPSLHHLPLSITFLSPSPSLSPSPVSPSPTLSITYPLSIISPLFITSSQTFFKAFLH
ncbi:hypothetical protein EMCRGX_G008241 [Ephydatia muelleri]